MGSTLRSRLRAFATDAALRLQGFHRAEEGQEMTEYALITFGMLVGGAGGLYFFIPDSINAYKIYIKGFYMIIGLPIP